MHKTLLSEFISFIVHPTQDQNIPIPTTQKITKTIILLGWAFWTVLCIGILLFQLMEKTTFSATNAIEQFIKKESIKTILLNAALIGPTIEEILFRLPLKYTIPNLAITFTAGTTLITKKTLPQIPWIIILACVPLITTLYAIILRKKIIKNKLEKIYKNHFTIMFYLIATLFGIVHIFNYTSIENGWQILPLLIIPQAIIGIYLGFIRIKYGFRYAVLFHILYNITLLIPTLAVKHNLQISPYTTAYTAILGIMLIYATMVGVKEIIEIIKSKRSLYKK